MPARLSEIMANHHGMTLASFRISASALVLAAAVAVTLVAFVARGVLRGWFRDEETARRGATGLIGMWARQYFTWVMQPAVWALRVLRVPASVVTLLSVPLAIGAGAAISAGHLGKGAWLLIAASVCDYLDGRIARLTRTAGPAGAMLDSVVDRYVEGAIYAGLAWLYRDDWVLLLVLVACLGSMLVPYARARAEALGVPMAGIGIVQRPERIVILILALQCSAAVDALWVAPPAWPRHVVLVAGLAFLALTTHISSLQRLLHAVAELKKPLPLFGQRSIARSVLAAGVATVVDFGAVLLLRHTTPLSPATDTFIGCVIGGVTNYLVNRAWTYQSRADADLQVGRYAMVSAGSAGLNSGIVGLVLLHPGAPFLVVWWAVRALVFLTWNYPLHRDYVFRDPEQRRELGTPAATGRQRQWTAGFAETSPRTRRTKTVFTRGAPRRAGGLRQV